jgi:hypothetical protein
MIMVIGLSVILSVIFPGQITPVISIILFFVDNFACSVYAFVCRLTYLIPHNPLITALFVILSYDL